MESEQKSLRVGYCSEELEGCQGGRTGELLTQGIRLSCCRGSRGDRRVWGVLVLQCCFVKMQLESFQCKEQGVERLSCWGKSELQEAFEQEMIWTREQQRNSNHKDESALEREIRMVGQGSQLEDLANWLNQIAMTPFRQVQMLNWSWWSRQLIHRWWFYHSAGLDCFSAKQ